MGILYRRDDIIKRHKTSKEFLIKLEEKGLIESEPRGKVNLPIMYTEDNYRKIKKILSDREELKRTPENVTCCTVCGGDISRGTINNKCRRCYYEDLAYTKFETWLETGDLGISVGTTVRYRMREMMLEYYGDTCSLCGIKYWKGKELVLILDHIDGDASNNKKDNLRFVCPNCDSQLPTFKSKNKNSARKSRRCNNK